MKKIFYCLLIFFSFLFVSCKEKHTVRFQNNYSETILKAAAGNAYFGTVESGQASPYNSINAGNFDIVGETAKGQKLSGTGTVSGKGKHKWTITLDAEGKLSITSDK